MANLKPALELSVCKSHYRFLDKCVGLKVWGSDLDFIKSMVFVSPCFLCFSLSSASADACENTPVNLNFSLVYIEKQRFIENR